MFKKINKILGDSSQKGFVLVGVLGTMAILALVGTTMMTSSKEHSKSSFSSVSSNLALEAAKSGVAKLFIRYNDAATSDELKAIAEFSGTGAVSTAYGGVVPSYYTSLAVDSTSDIPTDAWISANIGSFLVYDVTPNGLIQKNVWSSHPKSQQVAVWVESYDAGDDLYAYPYSTNNVTNAYHVTGAGNAKHGLSFVAFAIGSHAGEKKVVRERVAVGSGVLNDLAIVNNAPKFADNAGLCAASSSESATGRASESHIDSHNAAGDVVAYENLFFDSTQTFDTLAIKSNNGIIFAIDESDPDFDYSNAASSLVAGNMNPWIVYDEGKIDSTKYPNVLNGQYTGVSATTTKANLFGTPMYLNYFDSINSNLFMLDAYREAANRISGFDDETIGGYLVNTGGASLGQHSTLSANNSNHARTGTMSWADFTYNAENSIPMYGLVRVLIPTRAEDNGEESGHSHNICGDSHATRYIPSITYDSNGNGSHNDAGEGGASDGNDSSGHHKGTDVVENTGGANGKVIVYGALVMDYFFDDDEDGEFDAGDADEFVLDESQAMTVNLKLDIPFLINPVFDGFAPQTTGVTTNYTAIGLYQNGAPSDDRATDVNGSMDGFVDLGSDMIRVSKDVGGEVYNGVINFSTFKNLLNSGGYNKNKMIQMLNYYHLTRAYASKAAYSHVKISNIDTNSASFYIDTESDTVQSAPSMADLYHVFMPSGYVHGWKRGIDELGLTGAQWNTLLIGDGSPYASQEAKIFHIENDGANDVIDSNFADMPALMMSAGVLNLGGAFNISGVIYNPGMLVFRTGGNNVVADVVPNDTFLATILTSLYAQCATEFSGNAGDIADCRDKALDEITELKAKIIDDPEKYADKCADGKDKDIGFKMDGEKIKVKDVPYCDMIQEPAIGSATIANASYLSGATVSGYGTFFHDLTGGSEDGLIMSFDDVSTDMLPVAHDESIVRITHWEEVR